MAMLSSEMFLGYICCHRWMHIHCIGHSRTITIGCRASAGAPRGGNRTPPRRQRSASHDSPGRRRSAGTRSRSGGPPPFRRRLSHSLSPGRGRSPSPYGRSLSPYGRRPLGNQPTAAPTVFVGGLPPETQVGDVKEFFSKYGEVTNVKLIHDRDSGHFKGFGFVTFWEMAAADEAAAQASGGEILGQRIRCNRARETRAPPRGPPPREPPRDLRCALAPDAGYCTPCAPLLSPRSLPYVRACVLQAHVSARAAAVAQRSRARVPRVWAALAQPTTRWPALAVA